MQRLCFPVALIVLNSSADAGNLLSLVVGGYRIRAQAGDAALVTASAEMRWLNRFSLAGTFEGEFSGVTRSCAGKGVARYAW